MKKRRRKLKTQKKNLRSGSKGCKKILYEQNPSCDICGRKMSIHVLQFHHIFMVRHGFDTRVERASLLCPNCHARFHKKFDKYFDRLNAENHDTDFRAIYEECKKHMT